MSERPVGDETDRWLRRRLDVDPQTGARVAAAALGAPSAVRRPRVARRLLIVAAIGVLAVAGGALLVGPPPVVDTAAARTVRITNFNDLIAVMDPAGGARLWTPPRSVSGASPRLIIRIGEEDVR